LSGLSVPAGTQVGVGGATTAASDVDNWQFRFRVHRDFYP
jgi:hypothetical protein